MFGYWIAIYTPGGIYGCHLCSTHVCRLRPRGLLPAQNRKALSVHQFAVLCVHTHVLGLGDQRLVNHLDWLHHCATAVHVGTVVSESVYLATDVKKSGFP